MNEKQAPGAERRALKGAAGSALESLRFDASGLLPAIAQDAETGQVLMLAYMSRESLARTLETGLATYYSRSRQKLWQKGEESGHVQRVRAIRYDCDGDTLLLLVDQTVAACHTGNRSCFYRDLPWSGQGGAAASGPCGLLDRAGRLYELLVERKAQRPPGSYTARLFEQGEDAILKKLGEESAEVLLAAKGGDRARIASEVADLWFHALVLLAHCGIRPEEVAEVLARREGARKPDAG
ncbi:MAG TPA: bifunctional phosphoribosyl-AMP cyclohydrolase/phosphoribosyl-ATP diphosphatase HisIE [Candidatus Sulfotelmatobacter sp.]|nr:bifunctional phosphoribosyl-AMP cyclohydrolase/phosphoribosyl-ATP diphosphatase HisIE [Candidatus Sulfotelmatobacter sp.]